MFCLLYILKLTAYLSIFVNKSIRIPIDKFSIVIPGGKFMLLCSFTKLFKPHRQHGAFYGMGFYPVRLDILFLQALSHFSHVIIAAICHITDDLKEYLLITGAAL